MFLSLVRKILQCSYHIKSLTGNEISLKKWMMIIMVVVIMMMLLMSVTMIKANG